MDIRRQSTAQRQRRIKRLSKTAGNDKGENKSVREEFLRLPITAAELAARRKGRW